MKTQFLDHTLTSPLVLASGIWGKTAQQLEQASVRGCGAVTTKSHSFAPNIGHPEPNLVVENNRVLNAIGLANHGIDEQIKLIWELRRRRNTFIIASIYEKTVEEFGEMAFVITGAKPDAIELNISCPNVYDIYFSSNVNGAIKVVEYVKRSTSIPVIVKLAPNFANITTIARAVVDAGADAINAVNTMPGMSINIETGQLSLSKGSGGMSGPALKPIAIKAVYDIRKACPTIPIIGTGGVTRGEDAVEMLMAGANLVSIGSATQLRENAIPIISSELKLWLHLNNTTISEIQNKAHQ